MAEIDGHPQAEPQPREVPLSPLVIRARDLFQGQREIWIEHDGKRYRLRITRRNKLILQK
ncbi:MAG TPA: hemin uptake protein HemP [Gemmataceae bacterium]|nr:hemin uptake protein HemP [Gemmataceae bacterium]